MGGCFFQESIINFGWVENLGGLGLVAEVALFITTTAETFGHWVKTKVSPKLSRNRTHC